MASWEPPDETGWMIATRGAVFALMGLRLRPGEGEDDDGSVIFSYSAPCFPALATGPEDGYGQGDTTGQTDRDGVKKGGRGTGSRMFGRVEAVTLPAPASDDALSIHNDVARGVEPVEPCVDDEHDCIGSECDDDGGRRGPCSGDGAARGIQGGGPGSECVTDADCDDRNECSIDRCSDWCQCEYWPRYSGVCESDGNPCTFGFCDIGVCLDGIPRSCDDGNACTADGCNPAIGCLHTPIKCGDGNPCTTDGCDHVPITGPACQDDGDPCTRDVCDRGDCEHPPNPGAECEDDGNGCTDDICDADGACTHPPKVCKDEDKDPCTKPVCKSCIGCVEEPCCTDGNPCTQDLCGYCDCDGSEDVCLGCEYPDRYPQPSEEDRCFTHGCSIGIVPVSPEGWPDYVPVNDDDDNGNGIEDYLDAGPVSGEYDLLKFQTGWDGCPPALCKDPEETPRWEIGPAVGDSFMFYRDSWKAEPVARYGAGFKKAEIWPPPAYLYMEGRSPTDACRVPIRLRLLCKSGETCVKQILGVKVVKVAKLEWQLYQESGSADNCTPPDGQEGFSRCPNNGGVRVFPGKIAPVDPAADLRRYVDLVATVDPPIAGVTVFFHVFDVDDPFNQLYPEIPNVNVIDPNDGSTQPVPVGFDNRGSTPGNLSGVTNPNGQARVTIAVSLQPGDNYRAIAALRSEARSDATQAQADALNLRTDKWGNTVSNAGFTGYQAPVMWSPMLTVWRKLHVEVDSMARPTFAENTVSGAWSSPYFDGGQLWIHIPDQPYYDDLENGYVRIQAEGFLDLLSIIIDHNTVWSDDVVRTNISEATWDGRPGAGDFWGSDDDLADQANFLAAVVGSDIGIGDPPNGHLPLPDTSRLAHHYQPAYILPVVEAQHTSLGAVPFRKNINQVEDEPAWIPVLASRTLAVSTPDHWTAYIYAAFQAEGWEDYDGEVEATKGINTHVEGSTHGRWEPEYTGMSAIFVEALRDGFGDLQHQIAVAHEIAHTLGVDHTVELMDEREQTDHFAAQSLVELRSYTGP